MKRAALISSAAIQRAMEVTQPGISEHQLFATVDYESRMRGAEILAYPPVVASGKNANIIHYINNNQVMQDGELVLMDAGNGSNGYVHSALFLAAHIVAADQRGKIVGRNVRAWPRCACRPV